VIQLFCPACENVVWVEANEATNTGCCPECGHSIHAPNRRKSRPLVEAAPAHAPAAEHIVPAPERDKQLPAFCAPVPEEGQEEPFEESEDGPALEAEEEEGEACAPWQDTPARFVPLPYRAEGGCSLARLPLFAGTLLLAGLALGWGASVLGQVCYLILLFPLAVGLALAALAAVACRRARLRNPTLAGLTGLAAGALAVLTMHLCDYQQTRRQLQADPASVPETMRRRLAETDSLGAYLDATAHAGVTVCDRSDTGFNLGYLGTYAYWAVELVVVAGLGLFGARAAALRPFCAGCGRWKGEHRLGTLHESAELLPLLRRGDLAGLASCRSPQPAAGRRGTLVLSAAFCPECREETPVDIRLERLAGGRGLPPGDVAHLSYPGEALTVLEDVFLDEERQRKR
jgi:hypothetical protein